MRPTRRRARRIAVRLAGVTCCVAPRSSRASSSRCSRWLRVTRGGRWRWCWDRRGCDGCVAYGCSSSRRRSGMALTYPAPEAQLSASSILLAMSSANVSSRSAAASCSSSVSCRSRSRGCRAGAEFKPIDKVGNTSPPSRAAISASMSVISSSTTPLSQAVAATA
ncbi:hypothetical protein PF008_g31584, partial [Phytophthora fragariae]